MRGDHPRLRRGFGRHGEFVGAGPKPDPEIFQHAAAVLGFDAASCRGIEDEQAEVAAIECAGMVVVNVGDARTSREADAVLPIRGRSIWSDLSRQPDREYHCG